MKHFNRLYLKFSFVLLFFLMVSNLDAQTIYVTPNGAGDKSGSSWANAAPGSQLQNKINSATSGSQVWVAAGEYQPAEGQSFSMKEGVKIYGGFPATGTPSLSDRNFTLYTSTLKGNGSRVIGNAYNGLTHAALLDGFTITGGRLTLSSGAVAAQGAGIQNLSVSPDFANLIITDNYVATSNAGVYNHGGSPSFTNVIISNNRADKQGGGMGNASSSATLTNVAIVGNYAGAYGGAMSNISSSLITLINVTIANNATGEPRSGAVETYSGANMNLTNCIISGNDNKGITSIDNNANITVRNSLIQGRSADNTNHNLDGNTDPLFVDAANGNFRLKPNSPALNTGDNAINSTINDLAGNQRKYGSIDLGAYEYPCAPILISGALQKTLVCAGGTATFSVGVTGPGLTYKWYKDGQPVQSGDYSSTLTIPDVTADDAGSYKADIISDCGTVSSNVATLTVNNPPKITTQPAHATVCENLTANYSIAVTGTPAPNIQWQYSTDAGASWTNVGGNSSSVSISNTTAVISGNQFRAVVSNDCDTVTSNVAALTVNSASIPAVAVVDNCGNSTLSTTATGTLLWSTGETTSSITVGNAGTYSVTKTVEGCTSNAGSGTAAPKAVPGKPVIAVNGATTLCANGSVTLSAPDGFATYLWSNGALSQSISVNQTDSFSVTVSNSKGCASPLSDAAVITVHSLPAKPVITASGATTLYAGGSVTLSAPDGFASYLWNTGSTNATITVTSAGLYSVTVTNSSGCSITSDSTVVTTQAPALTVSYMDGDKKQLANNHIRPYLQVNNEGNTAFAYKELTVRYWLTVEDFAPMTNLFIDWAKLGSGKIKLKYVRLDQPRQGAYGYIEYSFDASTGTLAANSNSGEIQSRIGKSDWTNFNEQDDYSYASGIAYTKNSKITLYRNGSLIWGIEPTTVAIVQSLRAYSQDKGNATATNTLSPWIKLNNEGNIPVNYKDITVRYWFTADGSQPLNWYLDYNKLGGNNVRARFVNLSPALNNADTYLEISFAATDSLYPVSSTGDIEQRIAKSNWSNFNQLNDYSYKAGSATSENMKVTVYVKGTLVYGAEPSNIITGSMAAGGMNITAKESDSKPKKQEKTRELSLVVLNNPVTGNEVEYIVKGAEDKHLQVILTDVLGRIINVQEFEHAGAEERHYLSVTNSVAGMLFLRAATQNEVKVVQVMRAK